MATALHISPGTLSRYLSGQRTAPREVLRDIQAFIKAQKLPLSGIDWERLDELCGRAHEANGSPGVQVVQLNEERTRLREELTRVREELDRVREEQEQDHHVAEERLAALEEQALDLADQLRQVLARAHTAESERHHLQDHVSQQDESLRHALGVEAELARQQEQALARAHTAEDERDRLQHRVTQQDESLRHARDYVRRMEAELTQQQEEAGRLLRELAVLRTQNLRLLKEQQAVSTPETQSAPGDLKEYAHLTDRRPTTVEETHTPSHQHYQHLNRNPLPGQTAPPPGTGDTGPSIPAARPGRHAGPRLPRHIPSTAWAVVAVAILALCTYTAVTVVIAVPVVGSDLYLNLGGTASMITCNLLAASLTAAWGWRRTLRRNEPRPILVLGLFLLAAGSLIASWTPAYDSWNPQTTVGWSTFHLLAGCTLQGLGEGISAAAASAVLATKFNRWQTDKKILWAVATSTAIAVTASGLLLSTWVWRIAFQVPPVIALLLLLALPFLRSYRFLPSPLYTEPGGATVMLRMTGAHTLFVCAIALTAENGWWSPSVVALLAIGIALLANCARRIAGRREREEFPEWVGGTPLIWAWVSGAVQCTAWLYCTLALQQVFGHAPWTAAAMLLLAVPMASLVVHTDTIATHWRTLARVIGLLATAGGLLWLTTGLSNPGAFPTPSLVAALALVGVGTAVLRCPPNGLNEDEHRAFGTQLKYSGALATALTTSLLTAHTSSGVTSMTATTRTERVDAYTVILIVCAEVGIVAALAGAIAHRIRRRF
ncbi:MFS transporter [Streptomyces erythrochromogenes]|uniref:MFS transporter n=1 Tax=Streptomyces erythrochromogenes TaxID=285574 RepID=UPI0037D67E43